MGMKPELHVGDTCIRQQGLHPALRPDAAKQPRAGVNNALRPATAISGHVPVRDFLSSVYKACQGGDGDCRQLPTSLTPERVCRVVVCPVRRVTLSGQRQREREREREGICFFIMHARTQACVVNDRKSLDVRLRYRSCKHCPHIQHTAHADAPVTFNYSRLNLRD